MAESESVFLNLHHASLLVADTEQALAFYEGVLGLRRDPARPVSLPFAGAWLAVGQSGQQIHLLQCPNPDPVSGRAEHGGRDRHTALTVRALAPLQHALQAAGVPYTLSRSGRTALFCRDPDGNALELIEAP